MLRLKQSVSPKKYKNREGDYLYNKVFPCYEEFKEKLTKVIQPLNDMFNNMLNDINTHDSIVNKDATIHELSNPRDGIDEQNSKTCPDIETITSKIADNNYQFFLDQAESLIEATKTMEDDNYILASHLQADEYFDRAIEIGSNYQDHNLLTSIKIKKLFAKMQVDNDTSAAENIVELENLLCSPSSSSSSSSSSAIPNNSLHELYRNIAKKLSQLETKDLQKNLLYYNKSFQYYEKVINDWICELHGAKEMLEQEQEEVSCKIMSLEIMPNTSGDEVAPDDLLQ